MRNFRLSKRLESSRLKLFIRKLGFSLLGFASVSVSYAHDNLVIIPLIEDDIIVSNDLGVPTEIGNLSPNFNSYIVNAFTIVDRRTNLEWQRQDDNFEREWEEAWDYCANLNIVGNDDWRLPNVLELQSLIDYLGDTAPLIYSGFINTSTGYFWSATNNALFTNDSWAVSFANGFVQRRNNIDAQYVRCVR